MFVFNQYLQLLSMISFHLFFSKMSPMHKVNILTSMNKLPANKVNLGNFPLDGKSYNPRSFKLTHRILKIHN